MPDYVIDELQGLVCKIEKYVSTVRRFCKEKCSIKSRKGCIVMSSEKVMEHFGDPRNVGEIENASGVGTVRKCKMR